MVQHNAGSNDEVGGNYHVVITIRIHLFRRDSRVIYSQNQPYQGSILHGYLRPSIKRRYS